MWSITCLVAIYRSFHNWNCPGRNASPNFSQSNYISVLLKRGTEGMVIRKSFGCKSQDATYLFFNKIFSNVSRRPEYFCTMENLRLDGERNFIECVANGICT